LCRSNNHLGRFDDFLAALRDAYPFGVFMVTEFVQFLEQFAEHTGSGVIQELLKIEDSSLAHRPWLLNVGGHPMKRGCFTVRLSRLMMFPLPTTIFDFFM
jgi:hypothetical protein